MSTLYKEALEQVHGRDIHTLFEMYKGFALRAAFMDGEDRKIARIMCRAMRREVKRIRKERLHEQI